ncbi:hypothetical protein CHLNCDRAFT_135910 [Chlorella variabilis]|uniref:Uncharacterized protein n=1 Tax=Chlorella variabilis TaxID=554065 RepID=E1ZJC3_CHLVA|nr:hypothetical protein CHLNCDRAFT_135910 [Chlorella variabilis]EFN53969.1 hypothetical protein CHLNCDRAFT_135910 [Chlorella variabilis]|eukprot:XP_005846071.1 hypothetical protein CHLNCDRAFT_135910 [Chlorella variabilis]
MAGAVKSYSLWVMPRGPVADKLHGEIRSLSARVPGAPPFLPHVTLLGGIHTTEADPYRISFARAACGAIFHQCVYLLCETQPDTMQARAAGAAARAAFGQDPAAAYMPHLSLLYSDISELERQGIAAEAQQRLLEGQGGQGALLQGEERGFDVASVTVWETEEIDRTLVSWRQLADPPIERLWGVQPSLYLDLLTICIASVSQVVLVHRHWRMEAGSGLAVFLVPDVLWTSLVLATYLLDAGMGSALALAKTPAPGWGGVARDLLRLGNGSRAMFLLLISVFMPLPPTAAVVVHAASTLLTCNTSGYCRTVLLSHPLSHARQVTLHQSKPALRS